MPTIYAHEKDGVANNVGDATHTACRDASSADSVSTTGTSGGVYLYLKQPGRGGGNHYSVRRSFFYFDTSGITSTVSSATFNLFRTTSTPTGTALLVKSTAFGGDGGTNLSTGDFDALPGFTAGSTDSMEGAVTDYSGDFDLALTWPYSMNYSSGGVALNSTALSDMVSNDYLIFAMINADYDYKDVDPGGATVGSLAPFYTANYPGTSRDPRISYTLAGYSHTVTGVAAANISTVKGVSSANIDTVIGVD